MKFKIDKVSRMSEPCIESFETEKGEIRSFFSFSIYFELERSIYHLMVYRESNEWIPFGVFHYGFNCNMCECTDFSTVSSCATLRESMNELFDQLIQHPKVRLKFLFLKKSCH